MHTAGYCLQTVNANNWRDLTHSLISLTHSLTQPATHAQNTPTHWPTNLLTHPLTHSPLTHSLTHSLTDPPPLTHSLTHPIYLCLRYLIATEPLRLSYITLWPHHSVEHLIFLWRISSFTEPIHHLLSYLKPSTEPPHIGWATVSYNILPRDDIYLRTTSSLIEVVYIPARQLIYLWSPDLLIPPHLPSLTIFNNSFILDFPSQKPN